MIKKLLTTFTFIFATSLCAMEFPKVKWERKIPVQKSSEQKRIERIINNPGAYSSDEIVQLPQAMRNKVILQRCIKELGPLNYYEEDAQCKHIGNIDHVNSMCVTSDNTKIALGLDDGTVRVWDIETGQELVKCIGHKDKVTSVCVTPDSKKIVSGSNDGTIRIWDIETGQELVQWTGHTDSVRSVCVTPDGKNIVSGSDDGTIRVWDIETGQHFVKCTSNEGMFTSVCITPNCKKIVSGSSAYEVILIYDIENNSFIKIPHKYGVASICVTPNSKKIVSRVKGVVYIWDTESGKQLVETTGHENWVFSVCITPDSKKIILGSLSGYVDVLDIETGQKFVMGVGCVGPAKLMCITLDGKKIVTISLQDKASDEKICVWDISIFNKMENITQAQASKILECLQIKEGKCQERWQQIINILNASDSKR